MPSPAPRRASPALHSEHAVSTKRPWPGASAPQAAGQGSLQGAARTEGALVIAREVSVGHSRPLCLRLTNLAGVALQAEPRLSCQAVRAISTRSALLAEAASAAQPAKGAQVLPRLAAAPAGCAGGLQHTQPDSRLWAGCCAAGRLPTASAVLGGLPQAHTGQRHPSTATRGCTGTRNRLSDHSLLRLTASLCPLLQGPPYGVIGGALAASGALMYMLFGGNSPAAPIGEPPSGSGWRSHSACCSTPFSASLGCLSGHRRCKALPARHCCGTQQLTPVAGCMPRPLPTHSLTCTRYHTTFA